MIDSNLCKSPSCKKVDISRERLAVNEQHLELRRVGAPPVVLGRFYRELLDRKLWPTQAQLAAALSVSKAIVTRSIQASLLPPEVIESFGGPDHVSFRAAEFATRLIRKIGSEVVARRALTVPPGAAPVNVKSILCTGVAQAKDDFALRLSPGATGRYIRIDSPNIQRVIPHLSLLQDLMNTLFPSLLVRSD
ncbi:hypothetical protein [Burkholderia sp. Bp8986]|uniref:hypothetical protein n=1 Tax=Burkholderia sp. Bp8986 TaxID=2184550 RepID=UPI000F5A1EDA|nr:hypothetical protein [Burkholderia sp. Bp8986]RQS45127.1 hypothetical protein DID99_33420 [Burkholderia sp. Bp8986]